MNRKGRAGASSLFLLELIIAILFFALASAVCVQIFVKSHLMSQQASQLNHAVNIASSAAQTIDSGSDMAEINDNLIAVFGEDSHIYYDDAWEICEKDDASFSMVILLEEDGSLVTGSVEMLNLEDNSSIYKLDITHHLQGALPEGGAADEHE